MSGQYFVSTVAGDRTVDFDDGAALTASFSSPSSVAFSYEYNGGVRQRILYIADTGNHRIRKVNLDLQIVSCYAGRCGASTDSETLSLVSRPEQPPVTWLIVEAIIAGPRFTAAGFRGWSRRHCQILKPPRRRGRLGRCRVCC